MAAKKLANAITECASDEAWAALMNESERKLVVVDVYKEWCGPCVVMKSTFERIFLEYDECDKRVAFVTVNPAKVKELEKYTEHQTCKPMFLFYRNKVLLHTVHGANAPEVLSTVQENIPPVPEEE